MRSFQIGLAFSTDKFGIKTGPLFTNEPLKTSLGSGPIPKGLYFSTRFQMPDACDNSFCELAKTIFGKDTWFQFTGTIWTASFKIAAAFFNRVIKDELKFKKIEVFVEVSSPTGLTWVLDKGNGDSDAIPEFVNLKT